MDSCSIVQSSLVLLERADGVRAGGCQRGNGGGGEGEEAGFNIVIQRGGGGGQGDEQSFFVLV
jgi:hypothetical protein